MKYTNDELKSMAFTENFIKMIENISEEDGYEYQVMRSAASKDMYYIDDEEKLIQTHIKHISEDYFIEDRLEAVVSNGYISNSNVVIAEILVRKRKTRFESMVGKVIYADNNLIKEKFGNIEIDDNKIYRFALYKTTKEHYYKKNEELLKLNLNNTIEQLLQEDDFEIVCIKGFVNEKVVIELLLTDKEVIKQ